MLDRLVVDATTFAMTSCDPIPRAFCRAFCSARRLRSDGWYICTLVDSHRDGHDFVKRDLASSSS